MSEIKQVSESFVKDALKETETSPIYEWWDVSKETWLSVNVDEPLGNAVIVSLTWGRVNGRIHWFVKTVRWP